MIRNILLVGAVLGGLVLLLLLGSCKGSGATFIQASGRPGEVMLVMESEDLYGKVGHQIVDMLEADAPALPQQEQSFSIGGLVPASSFKGALQYFRNIITVVIDESRFTTTSLHYSYDEWARGQMVLRLQGTSVDSVHTYIGRNREAIMNMLTRHELYRFGSILEKEYSQMASEYVDSLFAHRINVPRDIRNHKFAKDFLWMSNAQMRRRHDLLVYRFPYTSSMDIGLDRLVEARDSVLKANIQGEFDGTYPSTVRTGLVYRKVINQGQTRGELRGLWQMEGGAMMGGPFVCHAYVDAEKKYVYVVEGFVYHPNENKLNLIRMMEASLYSFRPRGTSFEARQILGAGYTKSF
ncbi:MAG: DUF4837 family protein [Porphyromonadaceae bacterium]|nr:DUF4837 family protein [Porphyromonadaceae bacterium]